MSERNDTPTLSDADLERLMSGLEKRVFHRLLRQLATAMRLPETIPAPEPERVTPPRAKATEEALAKVRTRRSRRGL